MTYYFIMGDSWDADDFEPASTAPKVATDKWEGEDEDDEDVKDSWDKSDEEESQEPKVKAVQKKKKKKIGEVIAEREAAKLAEMESKNASRARSDYLNTPEGKAAEKLRLLKMEENMNVELARDMMGLKNGGIDAMRPESKEDFANFEKALVDKISLFSHSNHYNDFIESLFKNLSLELNPPTLKKIKMNVEAIHSTKLKEEKAAKSKKAGKKGGAIKMDLTKDLYNDGGGGYDDDMDDFM